MRQGHPPAEAAKISLERIIQYYPKFEGAVGKKQNKYVVYTYTAHYYNNLQYQNVITI